MASGGGNLPLNDKARSPGLVPVLAFALVVLVAVAVVGMLRLALPATPSTTVTPAPPAAGVTADDTATPSAPPSPTPVPATATLMPASTATLPAPSPVKPTASPSAITVTTPLPISLGVPTIVPTATIAAAATAVAVTPTVATPSPTPTPFLPPTALGLPPVVYSFYDWQNTNFAEKYPSAGAIGSVAVFGWDTLHTGPGQYDWSALDKYLAGAAAMPVTLSDGTVISKPIILEIVENESEIPSKQIAHKADGGTRFLFHDHTPEFIRRQIAVTLTTAISYTLPDGSSGRVVTDTGSHLAVVEASSTCPARTVAIVPKYTDATRQKYYREFVAALGARYGNHPQIVALIFGPGIDQEYGQATKDYQGCALKAQAYKAMPEAAYLDTVVKPGAADDLAHVWRAAFPTKPLFLQFTSTGKDRVADLVAAGLSIGLKQATLVFDNNNQWQSNGRGTVQLMHTYSTTVPVAWENAYDQVGSGATALQNRYFTILAGLTAYPAFMDFTTTWIKDLAGTDPWLLDVARANLGRTITTTTDVWVAMRGTDYWPPTGGAVTYGGWNADASYGVQRLGDAPLVKRADLQAGFAVPTTTLDHPYSFMARRTDIAKGAARLSFAVDHRWPFWQQKPLAADASGVSYEVSIKYLDVGTDSLSLIYNDVAGQTKSRAIVKTGSGQWVTATFTISDAYLAAGLPGGADFALDANTTQGGKDEVLHMVAVKGIAGPLPAASYFAPADVDRSAWIDQQQAAQATHTAVAGLPGALPAPTASRALLLPIVEPIKPVESPVPSPTSGAMISPPGRPTIPPVFYAFYEWRNADFRKIYPNYPPVGSQPVFGWSQLHVGPNNFNWTLIDTYLRDAANMTVTVAGTVISKPILLEIVEYESEVYSSQIAHDPGYANGRDPWAARIVFHDYTPTFVRNAIAAPLSRPITYANTSGVIFSLTNDQGSYLVDVVPGTGNCITRTVAIVPKYNNATWQMYYKQFAQALGARYGNHPQISGFIFGPGIDQEYGTQTKDFFECRTKANPYQSDGSYLGAVVAPGPNNDLLDVVRAAFPNKPVMLQFTGSGKDLADLAMKTQGYAYPVGLKQATLTDDNNNQYQTNGVGTIQLMNTYSQTTYIAWENAYAYLGPNPNGIQRRYFTLLAGLMSFPSYMDFIGGWMIDPELYNTGILQFVQPYLGRSITDTEEVWIALRDTQNWPPVGGGAIQYGGWHGDFTYALYRHDTTSGVNNPIIRRDDMSQAPYSLPYSAISHIYALIARRTDNASNNNIMSFYTDPRWGYNNRTPKSVNAAQGAWYDITLKYVDKGTDTLSLRYLDNSGAQRSRTITKTGTNAWVTTTVVITDAVWSHGMARGADLQLDSNPQSGGLDEIVHMVMIKGHSGGSPTPTPPATATPPATNTPTQTGTPGPATATPPPTSTSTPVPTPTPFTEIRVDAGGTTYVDTSGFTWVADQAYVTGGWGYYTGGSTGTYYSSITVTGTSDPQLFQSEQYFARGAGGYKFDIANGRYDVELGFAEIFGRNPGERIFDVALEGTEVLSDFDVAALVGLNVALTRTFDITVTDNQINIHFAPISDAAKINTIHISPFGVTAATPTRTRTSVPGTATLTAVPSTKTPTPTVTNTPVSQATASPTRTATNTPVSQPTASPTRTATNTAQPSPTATATHSLSGTRTPVPTAPPDLDPRIDALEGRYQSIMDIINRLLAIMRQLGSLQ